MTVVADAGYSNGEHGALRERDGITAVVPRAETVNPAGEQYFNRDRFVYDAEIDSWRCPAGETLTQRRRSRAKHNYEYWTEACRGGAIKPQCTRGKRRVIVRGFHEDYREAMHRRALADSGWTKLRREIAEHPFGTMKWLLGLPRFLVRGLNNPKANWHSAS